MNFTVPITHAILDWITEHPYQSAFHVINGVVLCTPAALTVPFFSALGFGSAGPAASSAASGAMSYFGFVPAGGIYATMQSAAMGGYGASFAAGVTQAGALGSSAVAWVFGRAVGNGTGA